MTALILSRLIALAKLIPWWVYAIVAAILYHVAAIHIATSKATEECNAKWQAQIAEAKAKSDAEIAALKTKQQEVITQTVIQYVDRVKVIHDKAEAVHQDIQSHVGVDDPQLPAWVRHDFDAAASGCDVPDDSAGTPCAPNPVATSTVVETAASNFEICHADQERLAALQNIVKSLEAKP